MITDLHADTILEWIKDIAAANGICFAKTSLYTLVSIEYMNLKLISSPIVGRVEIRVIENNLTINWCDLSKVAYTNGIEHLSECAVFDTKLLHSAGLMESVSKEVIAKLFEIIPVINRKWSGNHLINLWPLNYRSASCVHNTLISRNSVFYKLWRGFHKKQAADFRLQDLYSHRRIAVQKLQTAGKAPHFLDTSLLDECEKLPWDVAIECRCLNYYSPGWVDIITCKKKTTKLDYSFKVGKLSRYYSDFEYHGILDILTFNDNLDLSIDNPIKSFHSYMLNAIYNLVC